MADVVTLSERRHDGHSEWRGTRITVNVESRSTGDASTSVGTFTRRQEIRHICFARSRMRTKALGDRSLAERGGDPPMLDPYRYIRRYR